MRPLITYFSASGETKKLASTPAAVVDGDLFEIRPKVPYTAADLDWHDKASRSTIEMSDTDAILQRSAKAANWKLGKRMRADASTQEVAA